MTGMPKGTLESQHPKLRIGGVKHKCPKRQTKAKSPNYYS